MRKVVAGSLIGGTVVVLGVAGSVSAAVMHNGHNVHAVHAGNAAPGKGTGLWTASASPTPSWTATSTPPARSAATKASAAKSAATMAPISYTVKPGDNLSVISAWFHLHGYGALYDANRAVIGNDPNLIFPGQRITISGGKLTTSMK